MRKFYTFLMSALLSSLGAPLQAQEYPTVDLEFRSSFQAQTRDASYDPESLNYVDGNAESRMGFQLDRGHVNVQGEVDPGLRYRLRLRLDANLDESGRNDGTRSSLEYWYVEQHIGNGLDYKLGKQFILQGGQEGTRNGLDVYRYSIQGERIQDLFEVGLSVVQEFRFRGNEAAQYVVLQLNNQPGGNAEDEQNLAYNAAWYGSLGAGLLEPVFQLGIYPKQSNMTSSACSALSCLIPERLISAGVRVNLGESQVDVDLINGSYYGVNVAGNAIERQASTLSAEYRQLASSAPARSLLPFAKWTYDTLTDAKENPAYLDYRNELSAGVEMYPYPDDQFRLHALGAFQSVQLGGGAFSQYLLNVGVSARF